MPPAILVASCLLILVAPAVAQDKTVPAYKPGNGVTTPKLINDVKPFYPADAMRRGVSGSVKLECVVRPDGAVDDVRVVQSLDSVIDGEAVRVLKKWTFSPGLKDGEAVPVLVQVEMSFSLRPPGRPSPQRR